MRSAGLFVLEFQSGINNSELLTQDSFRYSPFEGGEGGCLHRRARIPALVRYGQVLAFPYAFLILPSWEGQGWVLPIAHLLTFP
ncbi:hypothetical protein FHS90_000158 [Rufibacter quisquiliarum]|uniref:Uncharacterized protein n=1 Tax=Rufibacter quisquiliarum TaxID=1549639 RepID=A0A839GNP2_9BACT|nr:hypothetical protein [Rufibacter quisquiliarum]